MADAAFSRCGPFVVVPMGLPGDHAGKTATRVFLLRGSEGVLLIDSGLHAGLPALRATFAELGMSPEDLDLLLLTHEHMDHVGNNGWLKERARCRILGHAARADRVADNWHNARSIVHAFPEGEEFDLHAEYLDWMGPTAGAIDSFLQEGDRVDLGDVRLETLELPGHSPAEIGFFEPESRSLVIADPLLPPFNPVLYLYEDPAVMRATFDRLERFLRERDVATVLLAHDDPTDAAGAAELIRSCRERVDRVEASIRRHVAASPGIGFAALRDRVCDDQRVVREWRALVSIDASLRRLAETGELRRSGDGWHACD